MNGTLSHPIFWLWNAKNLETATIALDFDAESNFTEQCQSLLSHSEVLQATKQQTSFTELNIDIYNARTSSFDDWKNMMLCIPTLYPNLKKLSYVGRFYFKGILSEELDWNLCFGNLEYIDVDIAVTAYNAMSLMQSILANDNGYFDNIKALKLKNVITPCKKVMQSNDGSRASCALKVDELNLKHLIDQIGLLLKNRGDDLISLVLSVEKFRRTDRWFGFVDWPNHVLYEMFRRVLQIIQDNISFDGYLSIDLPKIWNPQSIWQENDIKSSLEIAQIINQIQIERNRISLCQVTQLIVELKGLVLYNEHIQFLEFWFGFDRKDFFEQKSDSLCFTMPYYS